jgi:hypothetical protein
VSDLLIYVSLDTHIAGHLSIVVSCSIAEDWNCSIYRRPAVPEDQPDRQLAVLPCRGAVLPRAVPGHLGPTSLQDQD